MKLLSMVDMDRSRCGDADDCGRVFDLSRLFMLTGKMFSNPRPASMVLWRTSSGALKSDAMAGNVYVFMERYHVVSVRPYTGKGCQSALPRDRIGWWLVMWTQPPIPVILRAES